uniref:Uncharacterized protein n=1 Tax=Chromera velia CCMP2878 TaxID=1169474 RepID=A0A0G4I2R2_9ALVE|eukprot:Cvel_10476.t1-p1 / transcript=Cvel_10476.t1 / gene=Cvel_10476 / organism=Chromera_velia_CCMP2878 / gene_product=hypothetical protein / transcript_product=hypothetical protein / location=Cvel_scaffold632:29796-31063(+) / protein_length=163 / sequence_SO=supercontig / SO=protein_coding / is_pseudo=false
MRKETAAGAATEAGRRYGRREEKGRKKKQTAAAAESETEAGRGGGRRGEGGKKRKETGAACGADTQTGRRGGVIVLRRETWTISRTVSPPCSSPPPGGPPQPSEGVPAWGLPLPPPFPLLSLKHGAGMDGLPCIVSDSTDTLMFEWQELQGTGGRVRECLRCL